jgi:S1-C subfamily serine protease
MSNPILELSNALASVVESAGKSVVRVDAGRWTGSTGIVWSADGLVITAAHTLRRPDVEVTLPGGQSQEASVVGRDPGTDLALLKLEAADLPVPTWADPEGLRVGQVVLALGWPGKNLRASLGILSNVAGEWRTPMGGRLERYVQPDVSLYPGFSGGPLADAEGRFVGLNTQALRRGLALTLTLPTLRRVAEALQKHGGVRRGYLGVSAQPVRLPEGAGQSVGLLLVSVEAGGPAEQAGLLVGDVLLALDGRPLVRLEELLGILGELPGGTEVQVRLWRGGQIHEQGVKLGERQ